VPAQALAKQVGGMKILYHGVLSSGPVNMVVPDGDLELLAELNKTIQALKAEGFIDSLAEKHFAAQ